MNEFFNKTKKVFEGIITKLSEALATVQGHLYDGANFGQHKSGIKW